MLGLQTFGIFDGARDETRTHTGFTPLAPETSASTISPPAQVECKDINIFSYNNCKRQSLFPLVYFETCRAM